MELMIKHCKAGTKAEEMLEEEDKLGVATKIKIEKKRVEAPPPASKPGRSFKDIAKRMSLQIRQASTVLPIQRKRIWCLRNVSPLKMSVSSPFCSIQRF